jgi:hypothetical protein
MGPKMDERRKIEDKLRKKEQEVQGLEERLKTARVYVQALQDVLKLLAASTTPPGTSVSALKAGSTVAQARDVILERGEPVHITALLDAMGKDASRENRASLVSSLAAYVRRGEIFTRPAPNTFGLVELGHVEEEQPDEQEPPPTFGRASPMESTPQPAPPPRAPTPPGPPKPPPAQSPAPPATATPASRNNELDDDIPF